VPTIDKDRFLRVPNNIDFITKHLEPRELEGNRDVYLMIARKMGPIKKAYRKAVPDDVDAVFKPLYEDMLSETRNVFVEKDSWDRIIGKEVDGKWVRTLVKKRGRHDGYGTEQDKRNTLYFMSMLNKKLFENAIVLGANLEDSMLVSWFDTFYGVKFEDFEPITSRLKPSPCNGERVSIYYCIEDRNWSKYLSKKEVDVEGDYEGKPIRLALDEVAVDLFGNERTLFVQNNKEEPKDGKEEDVYDHFDTLDKDIFQAIPTLSYGMNKWQGYHNIYIGAAINRTPQHFAMLAKLGLPNALVHSACFHEMVYQNAMRTSLRDAEATAPVMILVPDWNTANRLAKLVGSRSVSQFAPLKKRKRALTDVERQRRLRAKALLQANDREMSRFSIIYEERDKSRSFIGTFHENVDSLDFVTVAWSWRQFINHLKTWSKDPTDSKAIMLMNPSLFSRKDPERGLEDETFQGSLKANENFVQSCCLMLDFDNGPVSKDDIIRVFSKGPNRLSFIICNTYSTSPEKPNCCRVIFPFSKMATSPDQHKAVYDYIVARLEEAGYPFETSGLDWRSQLVTQSWHIPCTNINYPDDAFFETYNLSRTRDYRFLDPSIFPVRDTPTYTEAPSSQGAVDAHKVEAIKRTYLAIPKGQKLRYHGLFIAGRGLKWGGVPAYTLETILYELAGPEDKIRKRVPGIIKTLFHKKAA
jgi:hypothetical protein